MIEPPTPTSSTSFAKLATIFAVAGVLSFGLCSVTAISSGGSSWMGGMAVVLGWISGLSFAALIILAIAAFGRAILNLFAPRNRND